MKERRLYKADGRYDKRKPEGDGRGTVSPCLMNKMPSKSMEEVQLHAFLTLALDRVVVSFKHRPLYHPVYPFDTRLGWPHNQYVLCSEEKAIPSLLHPGIEPRSSSPQLCDYTG
jgi:hypothetical protein